MESLAREPGSFRDPDGYVIYQGSRVYRSLTPAAHAALSLFIRHPVYRRLVEAGELLAAEAVGETEQAALAALEGGAARRYVRQPRIEFINYPYEWSPRMLRDAALCTLRVERALIEAGFNLKDASAYNIQFVATAAGPAPILIDITSVEAMPARPYWLPFHQFARHFALPLMLYRYRGHDFRGDFLSDMEGTSPEAAYRMAGRVRRLLPPFLSIVTIPHLLGGREGKGAIEPVAAAAKARAGDTADRDRYILTRTVARLERLMRKLAGPARASQWTSYEADNSYPSEAARLKEEFVTRACARISARRLVNIGCNLGRFDLIAAAAGAEVIAFDLDLASVDIVYQRAREQRARIVPLRIDLAAPSPAIGWRNRERRSFLERAGAFDCVMALAVVHHLIVTSRIPIAEVAALFAAMSDRYLIVELVGPADAMFRSLARTREHLYANLTIDAQERALAERFTIVERVAVPTMERTLYLMEKR